MDAVVKQFSDMRDDTKKLINEMSRLNENLDVAELSKLNDNLEELNSNLEKFLKGLEKLEG